MDALKNSKSWTVGNGATSGANGVGYTDKNQEIERTKSVLDYRTQNGMDTSAQQQWYKKLTGSDWSAPQQNSITQPTNTNQYKFQSYDPTSYQADENWLNKAREFKIGATKDEPYQGFIGNQSDAGSLLDNNSLNELAYYLQMQDDVIRKSGSAYTNAMQQEIGKGTGLSKGWVNNYSDLQDLYKQQWAIEDYLADRYGVNSMSDNTEEGLSRASLGFRYGGDTTTLEERVANGTFDDPWGINNDYFNDPRNKGQYFSYMDYFDPTAYANQRASAEDGRGIEYWYNTNFAREHGYEDENWNYNINNFSDWRDLSHQGMLDKYGIGGTNWGGSEANLATYQDTINRILNSGSSGGNIIPGYVGGTGNTGSTGTTSSTGATQGNNFTAMDIQQNEALLRYLNGLWGGKF